MSLKGSSSSNIEGLGPPLRNAIRVEGLAIALENLLGWGAGSRRGSNVVT